MLYDILYYNWVIQHIFIVLPWIFFYELYIRVSHFKDGLWMPYDQALHRIIYSKVLEKTNDTTLYIDGEYHNLSFYQNMYKHYIIRGFIKDNEHI